MPLPSWKDVTAALELEKDDWRVEDLKTFMTDYVRDHMDVAVLSSDHSDVFYENLINEVSGRYHFVCTSENYPEDPTEHERLIRGFAMRLHNSNRAASFKARRQNNKKKTCAPALTEANAEDEGSSVASSKRKERAASFNSGSSKRRRREDESHFLDRMKMHGSVMSTFSAKLILMLNGEEKVDRQIEALREKSFSQVGVFVRDVAESAKPFETRWQVFVANEVMWEYTKGL